MNGIKNLIFKLKQLIDFILKSNRNAFLFIFLFGLLLRIGYSSTLENKWYYYDTVHYDKAAQAILHGEGFGSGYYFSNMGFNKEYSLEPVYPIFLASIYGVFGRDFFIVRIFQSIFSALICWFIFLIARRVFGAKTGLIATLISIFFPLHIFTSGLLYVTTLITFFLSVMIYSALKMLDSNSIVWPVMTGIFLGLATQSIPIVFAFYPFLALWIIFWMGKTKSYKMKSLFIVFTVTLLSLTPWTVRNYRVFHKIVPIRAAVGEELFKAKMNVESGMKIDLYQNSKLDSTIIDNTKFQKSLSKMRRQNFIQKIKSIVFDNPDKFLKRYGHEFLHFWTFYPTRVKTKNEFFSTFTKWVSILTFGPVLFFAILGITFSYRKYHITLILTFLILSFALAYSFFMTQVRYRIPIEPYLIIFAAYGIYYANEFIKGLKKMDNN